MTRQDLVLSAINSKKGVGLEIGPLTSPILSKREANIFYTDHMSQADLREKYKDAPLNIEDIVPVDYIVNDTLAHAVGDTKFDYVIACHVIEHIPDTVRWFQDIQSILKPNGILALAIPDKRFTFDITRRTSSPGDIVGAYLDEQQRPLSSAVYDFAVEGRDVNTAAIWSDPHRDWSSRPRFYTMDDAYKMCEKNLSPDEYVDCHCHVFTPHSFVTVLRELMKLHLFDFEVVNFHDTNDQNIEFYVSLRPLRKSKDSLKKQLASLPKLKSEVTVHKLHAEKERLLTEVSALRSELNDIRNSRSWKITKPLRSLIGRLSSSNQQDSTSSSPDSL